MVKILPPIESSQKILIFDAFDRVVSLVLLGRDVTDQLANGLDLADVDKADPYLLSDFRVFG